MMPRVSAAPLLVALFATVAGVAAAAPLVNVSRAGEDARQLVGEIVPVTLTLTTPAGEPPRTLRSITLHDTATGVVLRPGALKAETTAEGGVSVKVTVEIIPLRPGRQTVAFVVGVGQTGDRHRPAQEVTTAPIALIVDSAPEVARPKGFQGAVGDFGFGEPRLTGDTTRADAPLTLEIDLLGRGAVERVATPDLDTSRWWITKEPAVDTTGPDGAHIRRFRWTLVARTGGELTTPDGELVTLNPITRRYLALPIPTLDVRLPVRLTDANRTLGRTAPVSADELIPPHRRPPFLLLNAMLVVAFTIIVGLGVRRRRDLESPHRVIARAARERLHRLRRDHARACAAGDFAAADTLASTALRVALAPALGAAPDALTPVEMLPRLSVPEDEQAAAAWLMELESARRYAAPPARADVDHGRYDTIRRLLKRLERRLP